MIEDTAIIIEVFQITFIVLLSILSSKRKTKEHKNIKVKTINYFYLLLQDASSSTYKKIIDFFQSINTE